MRPRLLFILLFVAMNSAGVFGQTDSQTNASVQSGNRTDKNISQKAFGTLDVTVTDDEGKLLPDAQLYISPVGDRRRGREGATDESGKFHAGNLPPGIYYVEVRSPGFVESRPDGSTMGKPRSYRSGEPANIQMVPGGVITGTVTDRDGNPIVGLTVNAIRIREPGDSGEDLLSNFYRQGRQTDDRGIYRIYGLQPGRYMVYAGGHIDFSPRSTPFDKDAPTYYPSSTRDTGSVINVSTGQEYSSIDIRYRNEPGYQISGVILGVIAKNVELALITPGNPQSVGITRELDQDGRRAFVFTGVSNGNYKITARGADDSRKLTSGGSINAGVQNTNVSGLEIKLSVLGSLAGRVVLNGKPDPKCGSKPSPGLDSVILKLESEKNEDDDIFNLITRDEINTDSQGEFQTSGLTAGKYHLRTVLPMENWYIQSIEKPAAKSTSPAPQKNVTAAASPSEFFSLSSGENVTGLTVNISQDGGSLSGSIAGPADTSAIPGGLQIYLVPTEKERIDDFRRYSVASVESNGAFMLTNLAPGNYHLVGRVAGYTADVNHSLIWDAKDRANLRRDADAANLPVEIKPCQILKDFALSFTGGSVKRK